MDSNNKQYVGDGVYVSSDGYQLILETVRYGNTETIYLDGNMIASSLEYCIRNKLISIKGLNNFVQLMERQYGDNK